MHKSTKIQTVESLLSRTVSVEGCLEWTGFTRGGYGRVTTQGKVLTVTRLIWTLQHGEIPEGNVVRHTCDNPKCCNPEHLVIGTRGDKMQDRFNRGRYSLFPLKIWWKLLSRVEYPKQVLLDSSTLTKVTSLASIVESIEVQDDIKRY